MQLNGQSTEKGLVFIHSVGKQQNDPMPIPSRILPTWGCQNTADLDVGLLGAEMGTSEVQLENVVTPKTSEYEPPFYFLK